MTRNEFCKKYAGGRVPVGCPCCGYSDNSLRKKGECVQVVCDNCGLGGPFGENEDEAVDLWNSCSRDRCIFCGKELKGNRMCMNCGAEIPSTFIDEIDGFVCCFIDLLGFSSYTAKFTLNECTDLINDYATIFNGRNITGKYKSFMFFHPFSDNIFIIGREADKVIEDLSAFLIDTFHLNSPIYELPKNKNDIALRDTPVISPDGITVKQKHWLPSLFSGGISYGKLSIFTQTSYFNKSLIDVPNFVGEPLSRCVKIVDEDKNEKGKRGARIFCDDKFVEKLDPNIKNKYVYTHDGINELLWPVAMFCDANNLEQNETNLYRIFEGILNFYVQYKDDKKLEPIYFNTLKIIYLSQIQYYKYRTHKNEGADRYAEILLNIVRRSEVSKIENDLKDVDTWRKKEPQRGMMIGEFVFYH